MKNVGLILIAVGLALLVFVGYNFVREKNKIASPIPEEEGVKVIFVTPGANRSLLADLEFKEARRTLVRAAEKEQLNDIQYEVGADENHKTHECHPQGALGFLDSFRIPKRSQIVKGADDEHDKQRQNDKGRGHKKDVAENNFQTLEGWDSVDYARSPVFNHEGWLLN